MNVGLNSSLGGEYTIYDENFVELASTKNLVTDWGMRRFLGDTSTGSPNPDNSDLPSKAFCYNFNRLFVGTDATPVSATDWKLGSRVLPLSTETIPSQTSTDWKIANDGDLVMIYTHVQKLTFDANLPNNIVIREVGANWSTIESQDNRYGIFSRAVLPATGTNSYVTLAANRSRRQIIFVKYEFYLKTNCNKVLTSMPHLTGTGSSVFPANKTNVRRFPLYVMDSQGVAVEELNNDAGANDRTTLEYVQPLFENMSLNNDLFVGAGSWTNTTSPPITQGCATMDQLWWQSNLLGSGTGVWTGRKLWWLQYYTILKTPPAGSDSLINGGQNPVEKYNDFYSTTTTDFNNSRHIRLGQRSDYVATASVCNPATVLSQNAAFPWTTFMGRVPHDYTELVRNNTNTWTRKIQFFWLPNTLKPQTTVLKMYPATLGNWSSVYHVNFGDVGGSLYVDDTAHHDYGIVTVLSGSYTPNPDHYLGFEYNFTFTRQVSSIKSLGVTYTAQGLPSVPQLYYDPNNLNSYNPTQSLSATLFNIGSLSADLGTRGTITRADLGYQTHNGFRIFDFTQNSSTFRIDFNTPFNFGIQPITFNFWVSQKVVETNSYLLCQTSGRNDINNPLGIAFGITNNSVFFYNRYELDSGSPNRLFWSSVTGGYIWSSTTATANLFTSVDKWDMVTFVYQPKNRQLYLYFNGELVPAPPGSYQISNNFMYSTTSPAPSGTWRLGGLMGYNTSNVFAGKLGELKIYLNYIPEPHVVLNEYNNTKARYGL